MPRTRLTGRVLRNKMQNTVVVEVSRSVAHPVYKKRIERSKKYYAHTQDEIPEGTVVTIEESKPISKTKRWKVVKILDQEKPEK